MKRALAILLTLTLVLALCACGAKKDEAASDGSWKPTDTVNFIVPFGAGGGSDILTRNMMKYMDLGVDVIATNIEGGAGLVGAQEAAAAEADGLTVLAHNPMNLLGQALTGTSEVWKDLRVLGFVVDDWTTICVKADSDIKTFDDLKALMEAQGENVLWGCTGTGTIYADIIRIFNAIDAKGTIVPYDGGSESRAALLGGHIDVEITTISDATAYIEAGEVRALAVVGSTRSPSQPDVPTLPECGVDVTTGAPRAYFAPAGCTDAQVAYWEGVMKALCENEDFIKDCADAGFTVSFTGAAEGDKIMQEWYDAYAPIFKEYGLG